MISKMEKGSSLLDVKAQESGEMCHSRSTPKILGMGNLPPLMTESLFHGYIFTPTD